MRIAVMNHSFEHDIASLRHGSPGWEWRVVGLDYFYREAMKVFPPKVTESLASYNDPALAPYREQYRERLADLIEDLHAESRFDAFVAPSDSFFYLREAPYACHRLGVPFLVVQKETTIADWNMEQGARALRDHAPLVADHMTVCSERHRDYWVRAGADPSAMTVTGQPRFDFYSTPRREVLPYPDHGGKTVLFFSYLPDFYHPGMVLADGTAAWQDMLDRTEADLWRLAAGGWRVIVKPHPLQPLPAEIKRIRAATGPLFGRRVFLADPAGDVRRLIAGADVAVGFQSTVMLEAMVAGLPVVYTFWDREAQRISETLVPYHEFGNLIEVVDEADHFVDAVVNARPAPWGSELWKARRAVAEPHLGPLDGNATRRTVDALTRAIDRYRRTHATESVVSPRTRPSLRLRRYRARESAIRTGSRLRRKVTGGPPLLDSA